MKTRIFLIAAATTAFLMGCEKEPADDMNLFTEEEEAVIMEDAASDNVIEAMDYEVDFYTSSEDLIDGLSGSKKSASAAEWRWRYKNGAGPAITVDPTGRAYPKTITIDYGDGIELVNGRIISGKIIIDVSARPRTNGATREVRYENFYVDSVNIAGGATRTFTGADSTERVFSNVSDLTLTFADGTVLYRTSERTRTLAEGFETLFRHSDDVILISGYVNYEAENGATFSKTIVDPLLKTGACRFIVQGIVSFTLNGEDFAELDYGDGTCDDLATITKDDETRQITIGRRLRRIWRQG
ncbi:MAG: hypothetical protein ACOCZL_00940 [Bacteroidota bacterium]